MEISLPDEHGRHQILNIHTTRMKEFKKIADDVDMKVNYLHSINVLIFIFRSIKSIYILCVLNV